MKSNYDVVVVGGGFAGFAAACAAAREGAETLLAERNGFLGGAACDALVMPFMRYYTRGDRQIVNAGLFEELRAELPTDDRVSFREEDLKIAMETICRRYGVHLLYHVSAVEAHKTDSRIAALELMTAGRRYTVSAKVFVDATGDANLAAMAGCGYELGEQGACQPMTLCFRLGNVDMESFQKEKDQFNERWSAEQAEGRVTNPRENVLWFHTLLPGVVHFNTTRIIHANPLDPEDLTKGEIEARRQVAEMVDFLKRNFSCFSNAMLLNTAPRIGVRESRLIKGEYTITEQDILEGRKFPSAIARGAYEVDIHNPSGTGTVIKKLGDGVYYTIPYESCIPCGVKNLLVAGRCISSTHVAQSAYRIMPICASIGEGVGLAAGMTALQNLDDTRALNVEQLRAALIAKGALC